MKILIFNWKDIKNPASGGAEILTHEMAKRWVKMGHKVTIFTSSFSNSLKNEIIDGVFIVRNGHSDLRNGPRLVQFLAFFYYIFNAKNRYDVVIDEIHGIPFFTPFFVKEKYIALICEVADELWEVVFGIYLGKIGKVFERIFIKYIYKNSDWLTISNSTAKELEQFGVNRNNITVIPMGLKFPDFKINSIKNNYLSITFIGRLINSKGIEDVIYATNNIRKIHKNVQLNIIGRGDSRYENKLVKMVRDLGLSSNVIFHGFVNEKIKFHILSKSHFLIAASTKEGWGLTVHEAGYAGTPSIVYNVSGLRDTVINNKTGIITSKNTPEEISNEVLKIFKNKNLYNRMSLEAKKSANNYSYDNTAKFTLKKLEELGNNKR